MATEKIRRPVLTPGTRAIMSVTNVTSTATIMNAPGTYAIPAPSGDKTFRLGAPKRGSEVVVFLDTNSTKVIIVQTNSSATTFFGSTNDQLTCSTGKGGLTAVFVGLSTSQWALRTSATAGSTVAVASVAASTR